MDQRINLKRIKKKHFELNGNENTTCQNLRMQRKSVHGETFVTMNAYIRKEEKSKINNLSFHLRNLEKEEQVKSK